MYIYTCIHIYIYTRIPCIFIYIRNVIYELEVPLTMIDIPNLIGFTSMYCIRWTLQVGCFFKSRKSMCALPKSDRRMMGEIWFPSNLGNQTCVVDDFPAKHRHVIYVKSLNLSCKINLTLSLF